MKLKTPLLLLALCFTESAYADNSTAGMVTSHRRVIGHAPWESPPNLERVASNFTPFVYFGEIALPDRSCVEWRDEFDKRFDGIDDSRIASLTVTTCYNYPDDRRLKYEGIIEPWTEADAEYLEQFIVERQGFPVFDHKLAFRRAMGVVFDFQAEYLDKNGNKIAQIGTQELTLGAPNSHTIPFDFDAAEKATEGTVRENFLPYIAATFGERERVIAEHLYLPAAKSLVLRSALRFRFEDFSAKKMSYWTASRDNDAQ